MTTSSMFDNSGESVDTTSLSMFEGSGESVDTTSVSMFEGSGTTTEETEGSGQLRSEIATSETNVITSRDIITVTMTTNQPLDIETRTGMGATSKFFYKIAV